MVDGAEDVLMERMCWLGKDWAVPDAIGVRRKRFPSETPDCQMLDGLNVGEFGSSSDIVREERNYKLLARTVNE